MKYSLVNGERREAQPRHAGQCPACTQPTIAKCGEIKVWHWAHKGHRTCDPWWENETEWHRAWKEQFPDQWQEVVHCADNGEKHIADVKTGQGWVIEFQHSAISAEERRSRDNFYPKLVWVIDGTRRKRDVVQFQKALDHGTHVNQTSRVKRVSLDECKLLAEWFGSHNRAFIDFGGDAIWWLLKSQCDDAPCVTPVARQEFIEIHRGDAAQGFDELFNLAQQVGSIRHVQTVMQARTQMPQQLMRRRTRRF